METIIIYKLSIKKHAKLLSLSSKSDNIRKLVLNNNLIKELTENIKNDVLNKEESCINGLNLLKL